MDLTRREWLRIAGVAAGGLAVAEPVWARQPQHHIKKPNIVFILADDLGYGDLGCYGQKQIQTPRIDQMAAEGIKFTQCYAGSTVCAPSRCTLMTGYHTGHGWIRGNADVPLRPEDVTVAEVLKKAGYKTGLIGKWGLGEEGTTGVPTKKGFDYFFGYLNQGHAHNYYPEYLYRNEERVRLEGNVEDPKHPRVSIERKQYSHDLFIGEALQFIELHQKDPFFLYLAFTIPHANDERGGLEGNGMEVPELGEYADKPWPEVQKGKAAMITRMDRDVGRVLDRLKSLGIDEDTIVFFTSDNGPHHEGGVDPLFFTSSGPLRGIKRDLYEGGIRTPMIARCPGQLHAGKTSDQIWTFWDFLPTVAELIGTTAPKGIDGNSIVPTLRKYGISGPHEKQKEHEFLYWEFHERGFSQAVRMGKWKAVRLGPDQPLELYNLDEDLGESKNVAKTNSRIVKKIEKYLATARTENPNWPVKKSALPKV